MKFHLHPFTLISFLFSFTSILLPFVLLPLNFFLLPAHYTGQYCPYGKKPTDCPLYTYGFKIGASSLNDCLPCPAGYWCNSTGIATLSSHQCPVGSFCYSGTVIPILCPASTYRYVTFLTLKVKLIQIY